MLSGKEALVRMAALALGASAAACGGSSPSTTPDASTQSDAGGSDAAEAGPGHDSGPGADGGDASLDASDASVCATACPAPDPCHTQGTCDPTTKTCTNPPKADGSACNDGNACTQTDTCMAGTCTGANPVVCSPSDSCHVAGTCDMSTGQCDDPAAPDGTGCDDGNACTRSDACMAGVCTGSDPVVCTPLDQCHVTGTCDMATGNCSNPDATDGTTCNDGNACTQTDACMSGTCTGSNPVVCMPLDQCHVAGTCNMSTGVCTNPTATDGTTCNDGNACTTGDACTGGSCAGTPVVCTPLDGCHVAGTCSMANGTCSNPLAGNGTSCVDGNACTTGSTCTAGVCGGGAACSASPCAASLTAFGGTNTPGWTLNGVATYDTTANTVVLVNAGQLTSAGTVFYDDPIATDSFTVSFDFRMTTTGGSAGRADGIAFVLTTSGATALGTIGGGLGMSGLSGWGAELDIYDDQDCSDADNDHAGIDTLTSCGTGEPTPLATSPYLYDSSPTHGVGDMGDGQWRTATVTVANSQMSLSITDPVNAAVIAVPNLQNVALPGFQTGTSYWYGFSSGGGSLAARQEIRNVAVTFPSKRCL